MDPQLTKLDAWLMRHRQGALSLALTLASLVIVCWVVIQVNGSFPGDASLAGWIRHPHPHWPLSIGTEAFGALANPIVVCLSVAGAWLIVNQNIGPRYGILVLATVGAIALNSILKLILGPTPLEISTFGPFAGGNYPSGHVTYATSLFGILAWLALARGARKTFLVMTLLIIGMGPFRILDGVHWPSDVLAGYALGAAWTILVLVTGTPWAASETTTAAVQTAQKGGLSD